MEWVEASGKSLLEAKEVVLDLLGVAEDDAEFVVLSEPKAGLFGRLRGEARVQARVRPVAPPPKRGRRQKSDKRRDGERSRNGGAPARGARPDAGGGGRSNGPPRTSQKDGRPQRRRPFGERVRVLYVEPFQSPAAIAGSPRPERRAVDGAGKARFRSEARR